MSNKKLKAMGIMVLSVAMLVGGVTGCARKENADVQPTEVVEAVVDTETEVVEATEEKEEPTEAIQDTEMGEVVTEQVPAFTVTDMNATKYAKTNANVRRGASVDYEVIGSLSTNQKVTVTGQADTGWYRIDLNGEVGYVSNSLLVDQKVTVSTSAQTTNAPSQSTSTQNTATSSVDAGASQSTPSADAGASQSTPSVDTSVSTPSAPSTDTSTPSTDTSVSTPSETTPSAPSTDTSAPVETPSTDAGISDENQAMVDQTLSLPNDFAGMDIGASSDDNWVELGGGFQ